MPRIQERRGQIRTLTYVIIGFLFGIVFPVFASFTEVIRKGETLSASSLAQQWEALPVLLRFAAPVILAVLAYSFARLAESQLSTERRYSETLYLHSSELEARNQRLREMNEMLDGLVYTASHDLKTPVVNFKSLIQMARVVKDHPQKELLDQVLSRMDEAAEKFQLTIDDLLDVSRIEKTFKEEKVEVEIAQAVDRCIEELNDRIEEKSASITVDTEQAGAILFPVSSFRNLLLNILSNSLKFSRPGVPPRIAVRSWKEGEKTLLSIEDNGTGIDLEKYRHKLFRMFSRLQTDHKGSGTGLYIVKRTMDLAEGDIRVASEPGKGTTFTFEFPASCTV